MPEQKKSRRGGRETVSHREHNHRPQHRQDRLPTPTEIKAAIDPRDYYARALPGVALKAGRDGWSANVPCPFHDDPDPSFGVNFGTGAFRCFGCEANGGSIIDHHMASTGATLDDARRQLADAWHIRPGESPRPPRSTRTTTSTDGQRPPEPPPRVPIPPEALVNRPTEHPSHGRPTAEWCYRDETGQPLAFVLRFDPPGKRKLFQPQTWTKAAGWDWKAPPAPRPLYGLDRLAARPEAPALICEGEKAADAAAALLPELVPIASMNGAQAPRLADWSPLAGRRVLIWPDNDEPGAKYARAVADLALQAGAESVAILDPDALAIDPTTGNKTPLDRGWDAADALAAGWTPETIARRARWIDHHRPTEPDRRPKASAHGKQPTDSDSPPPPFTISDKGIFFDPGGKDRNGNPKSPSYVCPPLQMIAVSRDDAGSDFGRLIEFSDLDGNTRRELIADRERQGSGDGLRARLATLGFEVGTHPESRRLFLDLLRRWIPAARARSTTRTGWQPGGAFVLPNRVIGTGPEPIVLTTEGERPPIQARGTLMEWQDHVAALCIGNSRLMFALSCGFAAPLLHLTGTESGGFHLRGSSTDATSTGKTTALKVAASLFGPPGYVQRWRSTDNGLEVTAELHTDCLLLLDEIAQMDPRAAGEAAYMLANESGKTRLNRDAGARPVKTWRLLFLSTGEIGLREHMAAANKTVRGGQETRLAEIPADAGQGHGVFEDLHGSPDGSAFAVRLADNAALYHGTALVPWLETLTEERASIGPEVAARVAKASARFLRGISDPPGAVRRVAARFALAAVAGELATAAHITAWPPGIALEAAEVCFHAWLRARGGAMPAEERELLGRVRWFFERHANRFRWKDRVFDDHAPEVPLSAGFKHAPEGETGGLIFYVFPETFRREIVDGFDPTDAARVLIRHGLIEPGSDGKATRKERLPGFAHPTRCYLFRRDLGTPTEVD